MLAYALPSACLTPACNGHATTGSVSKPDNGDIRNGGRYDYDNNRKGWHHALWQRQPLIRLQKQQLWQTNRQGQQLPSTACRKRRHNIHGEQWP
jgi:hypothetical protein